MKLELLKTDYYLKRCEIIRKYFLKSKKKMKVYCKILQGQLNLEFLNRKPPLLELYN